MDYSERKYPQFSACGLNCGLCPRYHTAGASKCPGCAGKDFLAKHPTCGVLSCTQRKGFEYCYQCEDFPCKKYDGAELSDSFITHRNQFTDMRRAKSLGIDDYARELNEKIALLEHLLAHCDDGRRKSFFCTAVNLLSLSDVKAVVAQLGAEPRSETPVKECAAIAVRLLQDAADAQSVSLKLRKKTK